MGDSYYIKLSIWLIFSISVTQNIQSCLAMESSSSHSDLTGSDSILVPAVVRFGAHLFASMKNDKDNMIVSPLSVHSALGMLLLGSQPDTSSQRQLLDIMKIKDRASEAHEIYGKLLRLFNEISKESRKLIEENEKSSEPSRNRPPPILDFWTMLISDSRFELQSDYVSSLKSHYNSSIKRVGQDKPEETTRIANEINAWGKDAGFGDSLVTPDDLVSGQAAITLLSAVKVHANWYDSFAEFEAPDAFHNFGLKSQLTKGKALGNSDVRGNYVRFSTSNDDCVTSVSKPDELAKLGFHAIDIPLKENISYTIFEPLDHESGNELAELERQLLAEPGEGKKCLLSQTLDILDKDESRALFTYLRMPGFKFENDIDLRKLLMGMGLESIFTNEEASLTRIADKPLYVQKAKHKAVVEVTKHGLKAAAITIMKIVALSSFRPSCPLRVEVKNPFMFMVRYNKMPLFIGHVTHL